MSSESDSNDYSKSEAYKFGQFLASPEEGEEIVISGLAGVFPDSRDVHHFRDNLYNKVDMVSGDHRRWKESHPEVPQRTGKIIDIDRFDAGFFGLHKRQGHAMDPVIRLLLEKSIEAVLDAGIHPSELAGTRTGVFVGACFSESEKTWFFEEFETQMFAITGIQRSMLSNRVSYFMNLQGESYVTDTACSSSLYSLDHAYRSIRLGYCDQAIVGGSNVCLHPYVSLQFARLGVLSPDGRCKAFDLKSDGYARSEAISCVVLQKAKDSRRIYATVVHSKTNCDGYKPQGITFPNGLAQKKLLEEFYQECSVDPTSLSYLEAHGTGTVVGDPEEIIAIDQVLCKGRSTPLLVGSVKSNIGHTEPSSGLCSITKAIIAFQEGSIAPNLHYTSPRAGVEALEQGRLKIVTETTPFQDDNGLIGINSFGFGGGNAHVLLRKHFGGGPRDVPNVGQVPRLVLASGRLPNCVSPILDDLKSRPLDCQQVRLYDQIFARANIEGHPFRGFTIICPRVGEITRSVNTSPLDYSKRPLYLVLDKFNNYHSVINKMVVLPVFKAEVQRIYDILRTMSRRGEVVITETVGSAIIQIALIQILKLLNLSADYYVGPRAICEYAIGGSSLKDTLVTICKTEQIDETFKQRFPKHSHVLEIGPDSLGDVASFLGILGALYLKGRNFPLDLIYPPVQFPVSSNTPMISPYIKWDHTHSYFVTRYEHSGIMKSGERSLSISLKDDDWTFISGHSIDGRQLMPATGYLYLVWEAMAKVTGMITSDMQIVFENCRFLRATTIPKESKIEITCMIQRGSGNFEVIESNSAIVTGRVSMFRQGRQELLDLPSLPTTTGLAMNRKDIYKELRLRGYNYSGMFNKLKEVDHSSTTGLITWDFNWMTFLDCMLQMKILQIDTRSLFVPTDIRKLVINAKDHVAYARSHGEEHPDLRVYYYRDCDIIKCGGIEIRGLQASSIPRKRPLGQPVLEKYEFVPNVFSTSLDQSIRVLVQLVLENVQGYKVKCAELLEETSGDPLLSPLVHQALSDLPLIQPNLTILTKRLIEVNNNEDIVVEDKTIVAETDCTLVIGSGLLHKTMKLTQAFAALKDNGFVLTRERDLQPSLSALAEIVAVHQTPDEVLCLLRPKKYGRTPIVIKISQDPNDLTWISTLQMAVEKCAKDVVITSINSCTSGILGLVNCLRREPTTSHIRAVLTFDDSPDFDINNPFYADQLRKNLAVNVFKNRTWGTYRHLLLNELTHVDSEHCFVNALVKGDLSTVKWCQGPLTSNSLAPTEQEFVRVYFSALNFRDIMTASARISADVISKDRTRHDFIHGFEFSGRASDGRRVMGIASGALSTLVMADRYLLWPVPDWWSLEDAATVPVVYSTILQAFFVECSIKKGESMLIHAGSGGIGQAAIGIALYYGLKVYTTVGTQAKREFIKKRFPQVGDRQIGNSRDSSFEQLVRYETNGRGVDYVLNSLAEEKLLASLRCLASGGKFLEIGKFDLASNNDLRLGLLKKGASFHGIMVDAVFACDPRAKLLIRNYMIEGIRNGAIKPLVRTVFPYEQVEPAFRFMASGKHVGKVLIRVRDGDDEDSNRLYKGHPRFCCDPDQVQVIVGGLGGFGLELADWLIVRGARKIVLNSRSGLRTGYQSFRIRHWLSYGVQVIVSRTSVTTLEGCHDLIEEALAFGRVQSVFNLAVQLKDGIFENQTEETFRESFMPKAHATINLDRVTRDKCGDLRDFVIFSSVSCGRGNAGQSNYGMANSIMERICEQRKQDGLPALAIEWGAIGEVGLVADMQEEHAELEIGGTLQQKISSCLQCLDTFLNDRENTIVGSMVVAEKKGAAGGADNVVDAVANILGLGDLRTVSIQSTLAELGMDSMTAVEIKQTLEREFEVFLTPQDIRGMTFARLIEIQEELDSNSEESRRNGPVGGFETIVRHMNDEATSGVPTIDLKTRVSDREGGKPDIVFFPGIEGVAKVMEPLANNIQHTVVCVQFPCEGQKGSIREMAEDLLPIVESLISKAKPFCFVSYSFGSVVALEVINLLEAKGHSGTLMTIDGAPDMSAKLLKQTLNFNSEALFQTDLLCHMMSVHIPWTTISKHKDRILKANNLEERLDVCLKIIPKDVPHSDDYIRVFATAICQRLKALGSYQANFRTKLKSKVKLFKPHNSSVSGVADDYKLQALCQDKVDVLVFKGNHVTILDNLEMADCINGSVKLYQEVVKKIDLVAMERFVAQQQEEVKQI